MIVDTNVLLRVLDADGGPQTTAARESIRRSRAASPLTVLSATVVEMAFVLRSARAGYGWDRQVIGDAVEAVLDEPAFAVEHGDALRRALRAFRGRSIDLHDCLLHAIAEERGVRVVSFDDDLQRLGTGESP